MHEFFYSRDVRAADDPIARPRGTLFELGLWIRLGFIGGSVVLAALVSFIDESTRTGIGFAAAALGGLLATAVWLRIRRALREEDASGFGTRAPVSL